MISFSLLVCTLFLLNDLILISKLKFRIKCKGSKKNLTFFVFETSFFSLISCLVREKQDCELCVQVFRFRIDQFILLPLVQSA